MDVTKVNGYLDQIVVLTDSIRKEVNGVVTPVPPTRVIRTDRNPESKPQLPAIGPAGSSFIDPKFGSKITRITDEKSHPDGYAVSFRTPGASPQIAWSSDSKYFYVESTWGEIFACMWDGKAASGISKVNLIEPSFDTSLNQLIGNMLTADHVTIGRYDINTKQYSVIRDLRTIPNVGDLTNTYVSGVYVGAGYFATCFGGASQDLMKYAIRHEIGTDKYQLIDTTKRLGCTLHATAIDKSGRYVILYPNGAGQIGTIGVRIEPGYVWDVLSGSIVPITNLNGHQVCGNSVAIDNQSLSKWDPAQWTIRNLSDPVSSAKEIINPILTPTKRLFADHQNWNHCDWSAISVSGTYNYKNSSIGTEPWRAWDDEIIGIDTSNGTVYRYCQHRSNVLREDGRDGLEFWTTPRPNVSPNGKWALFTSNMERTLGQDMVEKIARQDVFLVELT